MRLVSKKYYSPYLQLEESDEDEEIISEHEMEYMHPEKIEKEKSKHELPIEDSDPITSIDDLKNKLMDDEDDFLPPEPKIVE